MSDDFERTVTRHTFRRTFVTILQVHLGLPPIVVQHLARHRNMTLTDRAYTDRTQLPLGDAMEKFNRFLLSLYLPSKPVADCPDLSVDGQRQNDRVSGSVSQTPENEDVKKPLRKKTAKPQIAEVAEREGFEPPGPSADVVVAGEVCKLTTSALPAELPCSGGGAWAEVAELVAFWPTLREEIRQAVLTLVRASKGGAR